MKTLSRGLAWWGRLTPDTLAVGVGEDRVTFAELDAWASNIAADLIARGVKPGDRVAVLASHAAELCALFSGVIRARAIVIPLGLRLTPFELGEMVADFEPRLIFADEESASKISDRTVLPLAALRGLRDVSVSGPLDEPEPGDAVLIVCTSGSTARPKGVVMTNASVLESSTQYAFEMPEFAPGCSTLIVAPMSVSAASLQMFVYHALGMSLLFDAVFDARRSLALLVEYKMPVLGLAPLFWNASQRCPNLRRPIFLGSKMPGPGGASQHSCSMR